MPPPQARLCHRSLKLPLPKTRPPLFFFESIAHGYRQRYCTWVGSAKKEEVRTARAELAASLLQKGQKTLKIGSFMGDVGILSGIEDAPGLRARLIELCGEKSHEAVCMYGLHLAEHVLQLTCTKKNSHTRLCFDIINKWLAGEATFQDARDTAGVLFQLAQAEEDQAKRKLWRVLGHVANIPHVIRHGLIASDYAVSLINTLYPANLEEVQKERLAQIEFMKSI